MAEDEVGSVKFGIKAEFDDKGIKDAEKSLGGLGKTAGGTQGSLVDLGTAGGVAAGILGADFVKAVGKAITAVVTFGFTAAESASKATESMEHLSQQTGISLQDFQRLEPVFRRTGVSLESMGTTFRILSQRIRDARDPTSEAARSFQDLGIQLTGLETPIQVFTLIADRVSKLPNGFEKTRLETELLGRSGAQLTAVLNEGADGLARSAAEAHNMANVFSDEANAALLELDDSFDNLEQAQTTFEKHVAVLFAPLVQGFNESRIAALEFATVLTKDITIATRTLSVRFQALFGFLKEQAQLSILEIGKVPDIFQKWNQWAEAQITTIRELGVTSQDLSGTIGVIDEKTQALARSQAAAAIAATNGLIQVDTGWKITQAAVDLYDKSQKAAFDEGIKLAKVFADQGLADVKARLDGEAALQDAFRQTVEAGLRARQASGGISPTGLATASARESVAAIDRQISAVKALGEAQSEAFNKGTASITRQIAEVERLATVSLARGGNAAQVEQQRAEQIARLTSEQIALNEQASSQQATTTAKITALEQQRVAVTIDGSSKITQAFIQEDQVRRASLKSLADSELKIAQATFQDTATLRQLRLNQIAVALDNELSIVGRTEEQKTALIRAAEAERVAIAHQYPTFFQKQMQDLVAGNAFSLAQISTNFTNATAQWIVTGQNFKAFWQQLQVTLVQAALNGLIQLGVNFALKMTEQLGITTAMEAAKTAATTAGETARLAIVKATNVAIAASMLTTLGTIMAIGNAALAVAAAVVAAVVAVMHAAAIAFAIIPGTQELAGALIVGASVLAFGSAAAFGIAAAAIQASAATATAAIASLGALGFAKGGITKGPAIFGEAGPEAAIPLNQRGADFMNDMLGTGGGKTQTISIEIDGVAWRRWMLRGIPDEVRLRAGAIA